MKSLKSFKTMRARLECQVKKAAEVCAKFEERYKTEPSAKTFGAMKNALNKLHGIQMSLDAAIEMIDHYDFYQHCWEEEMRQAEMAKLYRTFNI